MIKFNFLIDPVKPNPPVKDKKNSKDYFDWINDFPKDPTPAPSPPTTLGDKQKVTLAKDIDPTVLKVKINLNIII